MSKGPDMFKKLSMKFQKPKPKENKDKKSHSGSKGSGSMSKKDLAVLISKLQNHGIGDYEYLDDIRIDLELGFPISKQRKDYLKRCIAELKSKPRQKEKEETADNGSPTTQSETKDTVDTPEYSGNKPKEQLLDKAESTIQTEPTHTLSQNEFTEEDLEAYNDNTTASQQSKAAEPQTQYFVNDNEKTLDHLLDKPDKDIDSAIKESEKIKAHIDQLKKEYGIGNLVASYQKLKQNVEDSRSYVDYAQSKIDEKKNQLIQLENDLSRIEKELKTIIAADKL